MSSEQEDELKGEYKSYYDNGQLEQRAFYQDGKLEGERQLWTASGRPWVQEFYRKGNREGEFKWFGGLRTIYKYHRDDEPINSFCLQKKRRIIKIKRFLQSRVIFPINEILISDLERIVYPIK
jgi:hypothetical protein